MSDAGIGRRNATRDLKVSKKKRLEQKFDAIVLIVNFDQVSSVFDKIIFLISLQIKFSEKNNSENRTQNQRNSFVYRFSHRNDKTNMRRVARTMFAGE